MKKSFILLLTSGLLLTTTSCATIITGSKDPIKFVSQPEGAKVMHKGIEKCTTPCTTEIPRSLKKQFVVLEKDGYENKEVSLDKKFNAVSLVNILLGGIIGIGVDAATGSLTKYDTKEYNVDLENKK